MSREVLVTIYNNGTKFRHVSFFMKCDFRTLQIESLNDFKSNGDIPLKFNLFDDER